MRAPSVRSRPLAGVSVPGMKRSAAIPRRTGPETIGGASVQPASPGERASVAAGNVGPALAANAGRPLGFAPAVVQPAPFDVPGQTGAGTPPPGRGGGFIGDALDSIGLTKEDAFGIYDRVTRREDRIRPTGPGSVGEGGGNNSAVPPGRVVGGAPNPGGGGAGGMASGTGGLQWKNVLIYGGAVVLGFMLGGAFFGKWGGLIGAVLLGALAFFFRGALPF